MRRRRIHSDEVGVSLFPFLAVLLCTMGALIVLLLVITDRARNTTDEPPVAEVEEDKKPTSAEDDPETWRKRTEKLASARAEVAAIVQDRRVRLGYLEQTTRELENQIIELKARLEEQQRLAESDAEEIARTEAELKRLESRGAEAERNLEEIRRENTNRPTTYSVVPYEGKNTTPRRPVYIECRGDSVVLQPEGVVLTVEDFIAAGDVGNPLATALRATREYLTTNRSLEAAEEPYPLIIIRPDATESYYAVRRALQGWTTDFGYELVNQDWKLNFGPADPNLAIVQRRALGEARLRQATLVAKILRQAKRNPTYRPAPRGGIVRDGRDTDAGTPSIPYNGEETGERGHDGVGRFAAGDGTGLGSTGGPNAADGGIGSSGAGDGPTGQGGAGRSGERSTGDFAAAGHAGSGAHGGVRAPGGANGASPGPAAAGNDEDGPRGNGAGAASTYGDPRAAGLATDVRAPRPGEYGARTPSEDNLANRGGGSTRRQGTAGGNDAPSDGGGQTSGAAGGSTFGASGNGMRVGTPDANARHESVEFHSESLANRRGRDWGLRYAAPSATPVTRPLRVVCYGDRAIVVSDDPRREPKQIVFKPRTRDSADEFVAAVWDEIKTWGIAGKGMYWRPVLSFEVHGAGDRRYEDLHRLLDGSGFEMRRKPTAVAKRRPVGMPMQRPPQWTR